MVNFEKYLKILNDQLLRFESGKYPENLHQPVRYFLGLGGKRIRPVLVLMGYELFDSQYEKALHQALAIELFHNFSLIHDDIMDKADLRRGQSTVHKKWNESTAILAGDLMLIKAYELLADAPSKFLPAIFECFNKMAVEVCEGQQMDMDFERADAVEEELYLEMIRKKTSVLLGAALQIGALRAGADAGPAELLYEFGVNIGMAFQMMDDFLDVFGSSEKTGKVEGGDVLNGKKTLLYLHSMNHLSPTEKEQLMEVYLPTCKRTPKERVEVARKLFLRTKSDVYLKQKAKDYYTVGINLLKSIDQSPERLRPLLELAEFLANRDY
ncbi:polyprenyl synthetase family protein [Schleiferia thermophila]|jgi:geranylgeranyl diphosphate synthase type II|uniref:Geranylgeranyl diphosphate synthase type II n=1 Tax=Schleiferia thermophila TaxID=884107 RepID=A0A369A765_9FLAO|nr:polyprenyl synthetase family protein [Schleiferia thermophila]KFD39494.1 isoprenyl synthetase [Schleiferia thermophila str. Yellowstone]RCX04991.1 geranylgeranyl diphosphate synthase type II [Schleiferia thermophila]GCD79491.1 isoprenyl synthetase [Schleiferia thermophila]